MFYNTLLQNVIPACLPEPVEGLRDKLTERAIPGIYRSNVALVFESLRQTNAK